MERIDYSIEEQERKKMYYILNSLDNRREKRIQGESAMMQMVQKVKFGATNYSD